DALPISAFNLPNFSASCASIPSVRKNPPRDTKPPTPVTPSSAGPGRTRRGSGRRTRRPFFWRRCPCPLLPPDQSRRTFWVLRVRLLRCFFTRHRCAREALLSRAFLRHLSASGQRPASVVARNPGSINTEAHRDTRLRRLHVDIR